LLVLRTILSLPSLPVSTDRRIRGAFQEFGDSTLTESLASLAKEPVVIPLPGPSRQPLAPDPHGEEEPGLAVEAKDLLLAEPPTFGERLALDDLVESVTKRLIAGLGIASAQFAKLVGVPLVSEFVKGVEDRHPEAIDPIDSPDHPPEPIASGVFHLHVVTLIFEAGSPERFVIKAPIDRPQHRPP
jgi:hypothetical protein